MERKELYQTGASCKARADLMLPRDLFRAAKPTASNRKHLLQKTLQITETGQKLQHHPLRGQQDDLRDLGFFVAHDFQQGRGGRERQIKEEVERTHTLF